MQKFYKIEINKTEWWATVGDGSRSMQFDYQGF